MEIFACPCCRRSSVVWDARAKAFLCRNPECAEEFPPMPPTPPHRPEEVLLQLSWNRIPNEEIRRWLEEFHHPESKIYTPAS
jgi:hypothetical protein